MLPNSNVIVFVQISFVNKSVANFSYLVMDLPVLGWFTGFAMCSHGAMCSFFEGCAGIW